MIQFSTNTSAQTDFQFHGEVSGTVNYSPDDEFDFFTGLRYIPEMNYDIVLDSVKNKNLYFEASVNIFGSLSADNFERTEYFGSIDPYRIYARYTAKRVELRLGLQKIDFGSSTLLRPLQWFNQIDPRDPLQLTNGVYGALGRYYFPNNANIWLWVLAFNEEPRGFDVIKTYEQIPEFGGRFQYPVPRGEIAVSYHHRIADATEIEQIPYYEEIPEDRIGLDGKWDLGIGLWFEGTYVHKYKDLGMLTNQTLLNLGVDYTFGIGNGLNVVAEHLMISYDYTAFDFKSPDHISAISFSYPIGFNDNLSCFVNQNWSANEASFFLSYDHRFKRISGYVMAYYNPKTEDGFQNNELLQTFAGPGIRLLAIFNH